jgi:drug/metabolite transporter (DMT)-like permease
MQSSAKLLPIYLSLILTMLLWGGTFIAARNLATALAPADSAFFRFLIASGALLLLTLAVEKKLTVPPKRMIIPLICLGLTGVFAYNYFFFRGLSHITAGRASLIVANTPLVITLVAALLFKETITPRKFAGVLSSLAGAIIVISNGNPQSLFAGGFGAGEAALIGCVLSWSAYSLIGRSVLQTMSPLSSVCYSSLIGTFFLFFPAADGHLLQKMATIDFFRWLDLTYLGIGGTTIAFYLYYRGIQQIGAGRAAIFINLIPVFAVLLAWLILDETLPPSVFAGGFLVLTGVTLTNYQPPKKRVNVSGRL